MMTVLKATRTPYSHLYAADGYNFFFSCALLYAETSYREVVTQCVEMLVDASRENTYYEVLRTLYELVATTYSEVLSHVICDGAFLTANKATDQGTNTFVHAGVDKKRLTTTGSTALTNKDAFVQ